MASINPIFLCFFLCFLFHLSVSDLAADRDALIRFRSGVGGNTRRWNVSDSSPCSWTGVVCDNVTNRVTHVKLPGARLAGVIPANSIGNLTRLQRLSLRGNLLSGEVLSELGNCFELRFIFLQNNRFSGEIPATLFGLSNLLRVDISGNNFSGGISPNFNNLNRLNYLHLQNNQFTGPIPDLITGILRFNVSMNNLTGRIPTRFSNLPADSFSGNDQLCGPPLSSCPIESQKSSDLSNGAIAGIAVGSAFGSILIIVAIFFLCRNCRKSGSSRQAVQDAATPVPQSPEKPPEYDFRSPDHILVTENTSSDGGYSGNSDELTFFDGGGFLLDDLLRASAEMLGKGTVGTTYKAYLDNGGPVIVKRLKNVCVSKVEFTNKIVNLGKLYHENLVPIKGYYYHIMGRKKSFWFLISSPLEACLQSYMGTCRKDHH